MAGQVTAHVFLGAMKNSIANTISADERRKFVRELAIALAKMMAAEDYAAEIASEEISL